VPTLVLLLAAIGVAPGAMAQCGTQWQAGDGIPGVGDDAHATASWDPDGARPGVPGCDLLVAPDILEGMITTTGTAQAQLFLPNTPPLVGVTFHQQMIPIEVDPMFHFLAVTATKALQLTAGTF